jgi:hypothetical protein
MPPTAPMSDGQTLVASAIRPTLRGEPSRGGTVSGRLDALRGLVVGHGGLGAQQRSAPRPTETLDGLRVISMATHGNLRAALTHMQTGKRARVVDGADPAVVCHLPETDVADPELSIVVPAADEELTVGDFVEWCKQRLVQAGIVGEIVIVDSSRDPHVALPAYNPSAVIEAGSPSPLAERRYDGDAE